MSPIEVPALIFGPGLPPGGTKGIVRVSVLGIEVSAAEQRRRANVASVSLRAVGFGKPGLEVAWRDGAHSWVAHVLNHADAEQLLEHPLLANSAQGKGFVAVRRRVGVRRGLGWSVLASIFLLPVLLLLLLLLNAGTIAGLLAEKIPIEQEIQFGRQVFVIMRDTLKLEGEGPVHDAVTSIVSKLTEGSKYRFEVHVSKDETLNAFAMPGGIIVLNIGLIAATKRPEELAGILAHEVQHVELRHSIRGMIKGLGLRAA